VFFVAGTSWAGFVSWRKPIIFAISFAVTNLTLAWILCLLPRAERKGWLLAGSFGFAGFVEVCLISMQQWRGVPSHFNTVTSFDQNVVIIMGAMFAPIILSLIGIGIWSLNSLPRGMNLTLGMRIGMLFLIVGQVAGAVIILKALPMLREHNGNVAALYPAITAYKHPHAISLHAVQVLVVVGMLADRLLKNAESGKRVVLVTTFILFTVLVVSFPGVV